MSIRTLLDPVTGKKRADSTLNRKVCTKWDMDKYFEPDIEEIIDVSDEEDDE